MARALGLAREFGHVGDAREGDATLAHAALLHDVVEDTSTTLEGLAELGYGVDVLDIVALLTRGPEHGDYVDWIRTIAESGNTRALIVKLADIEDNTDPSRPSTAALPERLTRRYGEAKAILREALRTATLARAEAGSRR